jgi:hypothetical protein
MTKKAQRKWDKEQDSYLVENWVDKSVSDIAQHLGRTFGSIWSRSRALGLPKRRRGKFKVNPVDHDAISAVQRLSLTYGLDPMYVVNRIHYLARIGEIAL